MPRLPHCNSLTETAAVSEIQGTAQRRVPHPCPQDRLGFALCASFATVGNHESALRHRQNARKNSSRQGLCIRARVYSCRIRRVLMPALAAEGRSMGPSRLFPQAVQSCRICPKTSPASAAARCFQPRSHSSVSCSKPPKTISLSLPPGRLSPRRHRGALHRQILHDHRNPPVRRVHRVVRQPQPLISVPAHLGNLARVQPRSLHQPPR